MGVTAVIGAVFVDVKGFSEVPFVATGTNIGTVRIVHGGVCRNVCEDLANQGEKLMFVSMTEPTAIGRDVTEHLASLNVNLRHTIQTDNGLGMWLALLDQNGDLVGSISKQPDFAPLERYLYENGEEIVSQADNIILEIDMNEAIAQHILALARRFAKPVYAIVGNMSVILKRPEMLRQVRCFICNEIEAGRLFGMDLRNANARQALDVLLVESARAQIGAMVITMGAQGAVYCDNRAGESGFCPAIPCEMVDSTGAGDAFFAGTVLALTRGRALSEAVQIGTQLACATLGVPESTCPRLENLLKRGTDAWN